MNGAVCIHVLIQNNSIGQDIIDHYDEVSLYLMLPQLDLISITLELDERTVFDPLWNIERLGHIHWSV